MRLEEHISQLLYKHDCVIVPQFGAFITNASNVSFDEKTNTFLAPKKDLSFNSTLTKSDGILVNKIALDEPMSFDAAQTFIDQQVYFWQEHLKNGKSLTLKNIGSLQFNEAGKIDFKPYNDQNYFNTRPQRSRQNFFAICTNIIGRNRCDAFLQTQKSHNK